MLCTDFVSIIKAPIKSPAYAPITGISAVTPTKIEIDEAYGNLAIDITMYNNTPSIIASFT